MFYIDKVYFEEEYTDLEKEKKNYMFGIRKTNILGFFNTGTKKTGKNQFQFLFYFFVRKRREDAYDVI